MCLLPGQKARQHDDTELLTSINNVCKVYAAIVASVEFCMKRMNVAGTMYLLSVMWLMLVPFSTESVAAYALDQKAGRV